MISTYWVQTHFATHCAFRCILSIWSELRRIAISTVTNAVFAPIIGFLYKRG
jgi:hypothetical protein